MAEWMLSLDNCALHACTHELLTKLHATGPSSQSIGTASLNV